MLGHLRCFNAELKNLFRELRLFEDLIHSAVLLSRTGYPRAVDRGYARPADHLNDHLGDGRKNAQTLLYNVSCANVARKAISFCEGFVKKWNL